MSSQTDPTNPFPVRPHHLLRARGLWLIPVMVGAVVVILMTLFYVESVVDPVAHLHDLPVSIVNEDRGVDLGAGRIDLGARLQAGVVGSKGVSSKLALHRERLVAAERRMGTDGAFATLLIPPNFTASLLSLSGRSLPRGAAASRPTVQLLDNRGAGALGVQLADGVLELALKRGSQQIGHQLGSLASPAELNNAAGAALLSDPITIDTSDYRTLSGHSALGLSAFYVALLTLMCGFFGATIINVAVDVATGYATTDLGPRWRQRLPLAINRWRTLQTKWAMAVPVTALLTAVMLAVAAGLLGMDAPDILLLWLFTWLAALTVAAGTLALFAALGSQGQLVAVLLFVYLGLASSGGTVPLQALSEPLRLVAQVEPLRQILDATRSILYFHASGAAGLTRGFIAATAGLLFWLVTGSAIVNLYDHRGYHRMRPDLLAHVRESVSTYQARGDAGGRPTDGRSTTED